VKTCRRDFVQDHKWQSYLRACHSLIFVTAPGVATLAEIPEECGWQEISKNGAMLVTRKKAPRRPIDPRHELVLYKHLLMRQRGRGELPADYWARWLEQRRSERELGRLVGREAKHTIKERIDATAQENKKLKAQNEALEHVKEVLSRLGLDTDKMVLAGNWSIERILKNKLAAEKASEVLVEAELLAEAMNVLQQKLPNAIDRLKKLEDKVADAMAQQHPADGN